MNCPDGQRLSWGEKCDVQDECPLSSRSYSAISSNCSAPGNVHCPQGNSFSKVCHVDFSNNSAGKNVINSSKFAAQYCGSLGEPCKPSHGPFYHQCYGNRYADDLKIGAYYYCPLCRCTLILGRTRVS